jgi:Transposase DDE domain
MPARLFDPLELSRNRRRSVRAERIVMREFGGMEAIHPSRLACLAKVVAGVLASSRVGLTHVGRALGGRAKVKHAIKCVDRLLGNLHLRAEVALFHARLARQLPRQGRPILLLDWTDIGTLWAALAVTLVSEGRSIVICTEVHPRKKENNPRVESSLLMRLRALLPEGCRPILVTDAGFRGPWLRKVLEEGWDFVGRVRGRVKVRPEGSAVWAPVKSLWKEASFSPKDLGSFSLAKYLPVSARLVAVWKHRKTRKALPRVGRRKRRSIQSAREPWILATSLQQSSARDIVRLYALRMRIEQTFRDEKCPRFGLGLDEVRTKKKERVEVYLLLAILAHYVAMLVGALSECLGLHRHYQANTVTHRRVLSWARLGREVLLRPCPEARHRLSLALLASLPLEFASYQP